MPQVGVDLVVIRTGQVNWRRFTRSSSVPSPPAHRSSGCSRSLSPMAPPALLAVLLSTRLDVTETVLPGW